MKKFTDVVLYWANVHTPNDMSGKFQIDLTNLSAERINWLEDQGINVRTKDKLPEMGTFITAKSQYPILTVDTSGKIVDALLGNGTVADIIFDTYSGKNKFGAYAGISVKKVVVKELVPYESKEDAPSLEEEVDEVL